ncbi:MAG: hypothetical protein JW957_08525 [Candidatus Omnitrophica bacterium]|nr:hypothetical protein [Candidatus Omnitrophota bacterium]
MKAEQAINNLSEFDRGIRDSALADIAGMVKNGKIAKQKDLKPWINLHIHTFHSYNCNNWSPSRVVFEGWKTGLEYVGTVDFDTLAGLEETLSAGKCLGIKAAGGFESRVFIPEMKDTVINSPKEPGIYYLCGKGFKKKPDEQSDAGRFFNFMRETAQRRNRQVVDKLNGCLDKVRVDYETDILPLTPSGNPTERHIIEAYRKKAEEIPGDGADSFWAGILGMLEEDIRSRRIKGRAGFQEILRGKLIKYGGPGYVPPEQKHFPLFDETVRMIESGGGVPTGTWLDGTSPGEENPDALIDFLEGKGIRAVTVIPDRNYNIADEKEKKRKLEKLDSFMNVCMKRRMPVVCGTEMNKSGQPFVDDFTNSAIAQYLPYFLSSASVFF